MSVTEIVTNAQVAGIIRWFERQRAYRAQVAHIELPVAGEEQVQDQEMQDEDNEGEMQKEIDVMLEDFKEYQVILEAKRKQ